jgi:hypothetical protein
LAASRSKTSLSGSENECDVAATWAGTEDRCEAYFLVTAGSTVEPGRVSVGDPVLIEG